VLSERRRTTVAPGPRARERDPDIGQLRRCRQGWMAGHSGVVMHTADGGESWTTQTDGVALAKAALTQAQSLPDNAAGRERSIKQAQRLVDEGADKPLLSICFADAQRGMAVGAYGLAATTDDGGKTWVPCVQRNAQSAEPASLRGRPPRQDLGGRRRAGRADALQRRRRQLRAADRAFHAQLLRCRGPRAMAASCSPACWAVAAASSRAVQLSLRSRCRDPSRYCLAPNCATVGCCCWRRAADS